MSGKMTAAERREISSLIRQRAKLEKQKAEAHGKQLIANADAEMERHFKVEDLGIAKIVEQAEARVAKVNAMMQAQFDALGVAKELRSEFRAVQTRDGWRDPEHRSELRRKARVEIQAAVQRRITEIDTWRYESLAELASEGLTSEAAQAALDALPATTEALPTVDDVLGPVEEQPLAAIDNSREAKRQTVLRALSARPEASNREIGRLLGVDPKTVGKVRAEREDFPTDGEEIPASVEEFPNAADGQ